jgi:hypothetical protein
MFCENVHSRIAHAQLCAQRRPHITRKLFIHCISARPHLQRIHYLAARSTLNTDFKWIRHNAGEKQDSQGQERTADEQQPQGESRLV